MWIDETNVEKFLGKTVTSKSCIFHYYPLTILKKPWGFCFRDRTGTIVLNDFKREPVYFDDIVQDGFAPEEGEQHV